MLAESSLVLVVAFGAVVVDADDFHDFPVGAQDGGALGAVLGGASPPGFVATFVAHYELVVLDHENRVFGAGNYVDYTT